MHPWESINLYVEICEKIELDLTCRASVQERETTLGNNAGLVNIVIQWCKFLNKYNSSSKKQKLKNILHSRFTQSYQTGQFLGFFKSQNFSLSSKWTLSRDCFVIFVNQLMHSWIQVFRGPLRVRNPGAAACYCPVRYPALKLW